MYFRKAVSGTALLFMLGVGFSATQAKALTFEEMNTRFDQILPMGENTWSSLNSRKTGQCGAGPTRPSTEFVTTFVAANPDREYLEEVRLDFEGRTEIIHSQLRHARTNTILQNLRCPLLRAEASETEVPFGRYVKITHTFEGIAMPVPNSGNIFGAFGYAVRKTEARDSLVFRIVANQQILFLQHLNPKMCTAICEYMKSDKACFGVCKDAGIDDLRALFPIPSNGTGIIQGKIWSNTHQDSGCRYGSEIPKTDRWSKEPGFLEKRPGFLRTEFSLPIEFRDGAWRQGPGWETANTQKFFPEAITTSTFGVAKIDPGFYFDTHIGPYLNTYNFYR